MAGENVHHPHQQWSLQRYILDHGYLLADLGRDHKGKDTQSVVADVRGIPVAHPVIPHGRLRHAGARLENDPMDVVVALKAEIEAGIGVSGGETVGSEQIAVGHLGSIFFGPPVSRGIEGVSHFYADSRLAGDNGDICTVLTPLGPFGKQGDQVQSAV